MKTVNAPPNAEYLINSLRSMGYSFETAIADIIDNSLSADATEISLFFTWNDSDCEVLIIDNGSGMYEKELIGAMTFANTSSQKRRNDKDLGRFGLGLKSASLSQARILNVFTKKNNKYSSFSWNLNLLETLKDGSWTLSKITEIRKELKGLHSGTIVCWRDIDTIFRPGFGENNFLDLIDKVEKHLSITFHRYLESGISIKINNVSVTPVNPFLENSAYYISPRENIGSTSEPIYIQAHLYQTESLNFTKQEKCFVYRGDRIICAQGLDSFSISKKLKKSFSKISIEISNKSDGDWSVNIMKSELKIPISINTKVSSYLKQLEKLLPKFNRKSADLEVREDLWIKKNVNENYFLINRNSKQIKNLEIALNDDLKIELFNLLSELENSVPLKVENVIVTEEGHNELIEELSDEAKKEIRLHLLRLVKGKAMSIEQAKDKVIASKIFQGFELQIELIANEIHGD